MLIFEVSQIFWKLKEEIIEAWFVYQVDQFGLMAWSLALGNQYLNLDLDLCAKE
jgi:hypothetical protein